MRSRLAVFACLLTLAPAAAHGQHSLAMHTHSGAGGSSACAPGRFDGPIELYPPQEAGDLFHKLNTNPTAQRYFNQGLTFFYGFDSESAMRSFQKAALADKDLAMAHWGIALAAGGDLNIPTDDPCWDLAFRESQIAYDLRPKASPADRLYIEALVERYGSQPGAVRDPRQRSVYYAAAMRSVYVRLHTLDPGDADAGALFVYSLMNLRPWLWWTTSGQPSAEISEALKVLESGLSAFPNHIGINHLYVHAMEEGPIAAAPRAAAAANFLFKKAPFITPHLRHMPAHTYLLLGNWGGAGGGLEKCDQQLPGNVIMANQCAVDADQPWVKKCEKISDPACNQLLVGHYYSHDLLFLGVGYNNRGLWETVETIAKTLEDNARRFLDDQPGLEHYLTTKAMMMVHFGKWKQLTELPPPQSDMPSPGSPTYCRDLKLKLASAMWYFGRVMGNASLGRPTDGDLRGFQQAQGCVQGAGLGWGNNPAFDLLQVAHWRMLERLARVKGQNEISQMFALLAVETEDLLDYDEPPGWYLSSRETYGAALYLGGRLEDADKVFREDQARRPNNSRSLFGRWQVLKAQGREVEAKQAEELFRKQWKGPELPRMEDM